MTAASSCFQPRAQQANGEEMVVMCLWICSAFSEIGKSADL